MFSKLSTTPSKMPTATASESEDHPPIKKGLSTNQVLETPLFSITPIHALALNNIHKSRFADQKELFISKEPICKTSQLPPKCCKRLGKRHCPPVPKLRWRGERKINMGEHYTTDPRGIMLGRKMESHGLEPRYIQEENAWPRTMVNRRKEEEEKTYPQFGDTLTGEYLKCFRRRLGLKVMPSIIAPTGIGQVFNNGMVVKEDFPRPFRDLGDTRFETWFVRELGLMGVGEEWARMRLKQVIERTRLAKKEEKEGQKSEGKSLVRKVFEKTREGYEKYKVKRRWLEQGRPEKKHAHWVELEEENRRRDVAKRVAEKIRKKRQEGMHRGVLQRVFWRP
jgi:hypothetical protein